MKQNLQAALIMSIIFLCAKTFGQTKDMAPKIKEGKKTQSTYVDIVVNGVRTNFNYGGSNNALKDYKKSVPGAQVGISLQAGITSNFSLVPELYFIMKGGKLKLNNPATSNETTLRLYTVELPVLARFHFGNIYVNAGPSIAYNISGTDKIETSSKAISFKNSNEGFKRLDAGIQMGGGYEFRLKQKRVAIDLRYNYGLTNIAYGREIYNRSFIVSIHFSRPWKTNVPGNHKNATN